jgi:hypothetical protein
MSERHRNASVGAYLALAATMVALSSSAYAQSRSFFDSTAALPDRAAPTATAATTRSTITAATSPVARSATATAPRRSTIATVASSAQNGYDEKRSPFGRHFGLRGRGA